MQEKIKVSCVIGTKDAEYDIRRCIDTVRWADEIVVVDDFSSDRTVEIALSYTDKVFRRKMEGYPAQMSFAVKEASNDWVLVLDADERVTPALRDEILSVLEAGPAHCGYMMRRLNYFLGREIRYSGWYGQDNLKLFDRRKVVYEMKTKYIVNMRVSGTLGHLRNDLVHHTCRSLYDYFKRMNLWSSLDAEDLINKGVRINSFNGAYYFFIKPAAVFLRKYFLMRGYKDRFAGFLISVFSGCVYFMSHAKVIRRQHMGHERRWRFMQIAWKNDPIQKGEIKYREKEIF